MRAGLFFVLLFGFGCAGPDVSRPHINAESSGNTCRSGQPSMERGRAAEGRCSSPSAGWTRVGEVLSGAATAVRMPRP
ncbi:MAG: hypothetical protein Q8L77_00520 [Nitrospirota bacterium]|nr:hypothetical protein [Nitrospirota bacterium]